MAKQAVLFIIKPDSMKSGKSASIMAQLEKIDVNIFCKIHRFCLKEEEVLSLYQDHKEKPFFPEVYLFMRSGEVDLLVLTGEDTIKKCRNLLGDTDPKKAEPGTIRRLFGSNLTANAAHCSNSSLEARREIGLFFPEIIAQLEAEGYL